MDKQDELKAGWDYTQGEGPYHFEHVLLTEAQKKEELAQEIHIVETINGTLVMSAKPKQVHLNKYFEFDLDRAIGLAARMVIDFHEIAETVVAIRPATQEETTLFFAANEYFSKRLPVAIAETVLK